MSKCTHDWDNVGLKEFPQSMDAYYLLGITHKTYIAQVCKKCNKHRYVYSPPIEEL